MFDFDSLLVIAGPCSIESESQCVAIAQTLVQNKIEFFRGGSFKPRTYVDSFQGNGLKALKLHSEVSKQFGLKVVSEILDPRDVEKSLDYIDVIQIGSRNMQNFSLLVEASKTNKPIILKRGFANTIDETKGALSYLLKNKNPNEVLLIERGLRNFDQNSRFLLDLGIFQTQMGVKVGVDPSHSSGKREWVSAFANAGIAAGATAVMVEIHPNPDESVSDSRQAMDLESFSNCLPVWRKVYEVVHV